MKRKKKETDISVSKWSRNEIKKEISKYKQRERAEKLRGKTCQKNIKRTSD